MTRRSRGRPNIAHMPGPTPASAPSVEAPAATPAQRLRSEADLVEWLMAYPSRWPVRWSAPAFRREVETVLRHLSPIGSVPLLLSSFEREGGRHAWPGAAAGLTAGPAAGWRLTAANSPVAMAYALRWIELTSGVRLDIWS
jgi:hypothetical protein